STMSGASEPRTQSNFVSRSSSTSSNEVPDTESKEQPSGKLFRRSRSGCYTCRLRRKKCDESHPACKNCTNLCVRCEYKRPDWWASAEQRRVQKERIKARIRQTKVLEKQNNLQDFIDRHLPPRVTVGYDF
ncbi:hypothetical protein KXX35_004063, partial [Aspergillus fumigatus]